MSMVLKFIKFEDVLKRNCQEGFSLGVKVPKKFSLPALDSIYKNYFS